MRGRIFTDQKCPICGGIYTARETGANIAKALQVLVPPLPTVAGDTRPTGTDEEIAVQAYAWIIDRYKLRFAQFILEIGDYIIKTFHGSDPRRALAKNKRIDQPNSLRLLIKKFQEAGPSEQVPSESSFYRAVDRDAQSDHGASETD